MGFLNFIRSFWVKPVSKVPKEKTWLSQAIRAEIIIVNSDGSAYYDVTKLIRTKLGRDKLQEIINMTSIKGE